MKLFLNFSIILLILFSSTLLYSKKDPKTTIAVIDLETRGATTKTEAITLTDRLRSILVRTKVYNVVDRGKMQAILNEVGFQQTGCTSAECAIEVGRILNVQQMVAGSIGKIGTLYTIDIILIDIASSQILKSYTDDHRGEIEGLIEIMANIANQLAGINASNSSNQFEVGVLNLNSSPVSAEVYFNNKKIGNTPLKKGGIPVGEHEITFKALGYNPIHKNISVKKGKVTKYKVTLSKGSSKKWWLIGGSALVLAGGAAFLLNKKDDEPASENSVFPEPPGRP